MQNPSIKNLTRREQTLNEELKIIIKAVTDSAKKAVKEVRSEIEGLGASAKSSSGKVGVAMKGIAKGVTIAIAAITAVTAAIVALGKKSLETAKQHAKLVAAFQAVGASAKNAEQTYNGLYRFLGNKDKATEAASHLALIARNQEQLAEWTKISQGIYARFGDSLPIEGLTEAANETLRVGKVTGTLADALNWAGMSEDEFNAKLATTTSYEEREALLRTTLNGLYGEAAEIYEKNNKALLDYNESQARSEAAMREAGSAVLPLLTALNNLGTSIFNVLKPALDAIIPHIATFVNWIAQAISSVASFFGLLTGQSSSITSTAKGLGSAASSAQNLGTGMGQAEKAAEGVAAAAEEAKRSTMGFDELNIVSSGAENKGSGASTPAYANNGAFASTVFDTQVQQMESGSGGFVAKIKEIFSEIATLFEPTVKAWTEGFQTIKNAWNEAKPHFLNGFIEIKDAFVSLGTYLLGDFIPNIVNSFSTNVAPLITDVFGFALVEVAKTFEWLGGLFNQVTNDIVLPAADTIKNILTGIFDAIGSAWADFGQPFLDEMGRLFDSLRGHVDNLYNSVILPIWNVLKQFVDDVWTNSLQPFVEKLIATCLEIGTEIGILYNQFLAPIVDWVISTLGPVLTSQFQLIADVAKVLIDAIVGWASGVLDALKGIVQFIVGVFTGDWEKAWAGIKEYFEGIWNSYVSIIQGVWDTIKVLLESWVDHFIVWWKKVQAVFDKVDEWFGDIFRKAWEEIKKAFSNPTAYFKEKWAAIKAAFPDVKIWFKTKFSEAWAAVKEVFKPVKTYFLGLWDDIKNTFTALGTKIGSAIGDSVKAGINGIIGQVQRALNGAIDLINGAIELVNSIPGVEIGTIEHVTLPKLATGGIATNDTIAHIGEDGYKEAVLPLDRNTEWMDRLADRIASRNNSPSRVVLQIDGKELGWATIGAINSITNQTGKVQLAI